MRDESTTDDGAGESGGRVRMDLCARRRDRRDGDRCTPHMQCAHAAYLDGLHGEDSEPIPSRATGSACTYILPTVTEVVGFLGGLFYNARFRVGSPRIDSESSKLVQL